MFKSKEITGMKVTTIYKGNHPFTSSKFFQKTHIDNLPHIIAYVLELYVKVEYIQIFMLARFGKSKSPDRRFFHPIAYSRALTFMILKVFNKLKNHFKSLISKLQTIQQKASRVRNTITFM